MDIDSWVWLMLCATGVLKGSDAQFNATVQGKWEVMTWSVRGLLVLTVPRIGDISSSSDRFSASFCSVDDTSCVAFTIHNTSRKEAGMVVCTVQGDYGSKSAVLHVEESGTVQIKEGDLKVVQDEEVELNCLTFAWFPHPVVSWNLNGGSVDSSFYNSTHAAHGDSFNSSSVLKFRAVKNSTVACLAMLQTLTNPLSSSVHLVVVPRPPDWTILIAVVCSFGGFALVVLLIYGLIFCYKRRKEKEPNYHDEMTKRVRTQSQLSGLRPPGQKQGRVNADYVTDGQTTIAPNDLTDSSYCQPTRSSFFEMPDPVNSHHDSQISHIYANEGLRKHRHATTV
ncbi:immunoglobulin superfamily member 5 isoform X2 [Syngnathoides biaculeatus]|uniref:immunoglobulin superfamily member 5 isoform X2 n=1 Tax=Syngnathoides biaculeatus TaxID=300417 RepID=UPI002ADD4B6A|nr:immunoglobulin superfamily member 5 isoform X2 [Syngnathoides biaculeatus]